jgi:8-oxo-dGTP pyrophosphatase MutT (NUDIX family)
VFNVFAAAALQSVDGAFLLGQVAPFSYAGQWVFPCGTLDPDDISSAGTVGICPVEICGGTVV